MQGFSLEPRKAYPSMKLGHGRSPWECHFTGGGSEQEKDGAQGILVGSVDMSGVIFCPQCGALVVGESPRFCASCGASLPSLTTQGQHSRLRESNGPRTDQADGGLIRVFHAFEVDTVNTETEITEVGIFVSVPDALLGLAQYVLFEIARGHAEGFIDGDMELPWGFPREDDVEAMEMDWRRATSWLNRHSPDQLVSWYRQAHPDLELFVLPRLLYTASSSLEEAIVMAQPADRYGVENMYLRRSENLLPTL